MSQQASQLPYTDSKPVGAADFYFAINATFRFILSRAGVAGLQKYWTDLGAEYFAPVAERWKSGGLTAIADYWQAFFRAEPGAEVAIQCDAREVVVEVQVCPAIKHLRMHGREIVPCFCHQCYFVNEAIAERAGYTVRVAGGNGSCRQTFQKRDVSIPPQDFAQIEEARC